MLSIGCLRRLLFVGLTACLALGSGCGAGLGPAGAASSKNAEVLVIPVRDRISVSVAAIVIRGLREAKRLGVSRIVLEINTPDEPLVRTRELDSVLNRIEAEGIATVAYVTSSAFGSGAMLALACREVWMAPGARIGSASPTDLAPARVAALSDSSREVQAIEDLSAQFRALVRSREGDASEGIESLASAMVDPRLELFHVQFVDEDGRRKRRVLTLEEIEELDRQGREVLEREALGARPLTLDDRSATRFGLAHGTVSSLEERLYADLGVGRESIRRLDETWSEGAAGWLEALRPLLLVVGFLLLAVELKTPGFAVPGMLGVLFLGMAMFGAYLAGLAEITEFLLFGFGIVGLGLEIFVVPGTLIAGATGLLAIASALILSNQSFIVPQNAAQVAILEGNLMGLLGLVVAVILGTIALAYLLPNTPFLRGAFLDPRRPESGGAVGGGNAGDRASLVGQRGRTATILRPSGTVMVGEERFDAVTEGAVFDPDEEVVVLGLRGAQLVVGRPAQPGSNPESGVVSIGFLIFLLILGLTLVVLEVFFVSLGVLSIAAAASLFATVFLAFTVGPGTGWVFLILASIGGPAAFYVALRLLPHTPFGRALLLDTPDPARVSHAAEDPGIKGLLNQEGPAMSDLRPAGFARLAGRRVDVVTSGELIPNGTTVRVIRVDGNRVVVRAC